MLIIFNQVFNSIYNNSFFIHIKDKTIIHSASSEIVSIVFKSKIPCYLDKEVDIQMM